MLDPLALCPRPPDDKLASGHWKGLVSAVCPCNCGLLGCTHWRVFILLEAQAAPFVGASSGWPLSPVDVTVVPTTSSSLQDGLLWAHPMGLLPQTWTRLFLQETLA